jgi:hypothetical protein
MDRPLLPRDAVLGVRILVVAGLRAPCPPWLAESPVLRKLARLVPASTEPDGAPACLEITDAGDVATAALVLLDRPRTLEELLAFLLASDYLLVELPFPLLRGLLEEHLEARPGPRRPESGATGLDALPRRRLLQLLTVGGENARAEARERFHRMGYDTAEARCQEAALLPQAHEETPDLLPNVAMAALRVAWTAISGRRLLPSYSLLLEAVDACLFRAADTPDGAARALLHIQAVCTAMPPARLAQLVRLYLRALYERDAVAGPRLDLRHGQALSEVMRLGIARTDLIPSATKVPWTGWLLPGSSGPPAIVPSEAELRRRISSTVPWLDDAWRQGLRAGLTGSLLPELAATVDDVGASLAPANDVDLWVEGSEALSVALPIVLRCMETWARNFGGDLRVEVRTAGPRRWCLEALAPSGQRVASAAARCDLYVNDGRRIASYHLPQVRASFDGERLTMCASCALAWATGVNIDYSYFASAHKTPLDIISRKWAAGFNVLLNRQEHVMVLDFLRRFRPAWLQAKCPEALQPEWQPGFCVIIQGCPQA